MDEILKVWSNIIGISNGKKKNCILAFFQSIVSVITLFKTYENEFK